MVCAGSQQGTQWHPWSCLLQRASAPAQVVLSVTVTAAPGWSHMDVPLTPSNGRGETEGTRQGREGCRLWKSLLRTCWVSNTEQQKQSNHFTGDCWSLIPPLSYPGGTLKCAEDTGNQQSQSRRWLKGRHVCPTLFFCLCFLLPELVTKRVHQLTKLHQIECFVVYTIPLFGKDCGASETDFKCCI